VRTIEKWMIISFVTISVSTAVLFALYVYTFGTHLSDQASDWSVFGTLLGASSMLLFSIANICIWLYQSRMSREIAMSQAKTQEQLIVLKQVKEKILFVSKIYMSRALFQDAKLEARKQLQYLEFGIHNHLFDNDKKLIKAAYNILEDLEDVWDQYKLDSCDTDIFDKNLQAKLLSCEKPLFELISFYQKQIHWGH